ncbi:MAG: DUF2188 domain-containing protein [Thiotrichales bacterium]|nr:DUF2188 domain-containing protein [Thiotrichales bacterium]
MTRRFDTQQEAIEVARSIARNQGGRGLHLRTRRSHSRARLLRARPLPAARIAQFARG